VIKSEVLLGYNLTLSEYKNRLVAEFNPPLDNPTLFTINIKSSNQNTRLNS